MSSNPPQSGNQGQSTATPVASTQPASSTPLAAQAPARSYANATKKSATDSTAVPVTVGGSAQHGQSSSVSVNGKPMQKQSQQSASSGVTIVNGAPSASAASSGDHSRKPSVTITSSGTSGYMPNGGGPASRPNSLQFGFQQSSPNMGAPAVPASNQQAGLGAPSTNPRITSPQTSPSPIPQPASSGGRPPPSTYQAQGNVPNFGSFGESADANVSASAPSLLSDPGVHSVTPPVRDLFKSLFSCFRPGFAHIDVFDFTGTRCSALASRVLPIHPQRYEQPHGQPLKLPRRSRSRILPARLPGTADALLP